jgi:hypothetical protein
MFEGFLVKYNMFIIQRFCPNNISLSFETRPGKVNKIFKTGNVDAKW